MGEGIQEERAILLFGVGEGADAVGGPRERRMSPFFTLLKGQSWYRIELLLSFRRRAGVPRALLV
jgi:hypothetical protein